MGTQTWKVRLLRARPTACLRPALRRDVRELPSQITPTVDSDDEAFSRVAGRRRNCPTPSLLASSAPADSRVRTSRRDWDAGIRRGAPRRAGDRSGSRRVEQVRLPEQLWRTGVSGGLPRLPRPCCSPTAPRQGSGLRGCGAHRLARGGRNSFASSSQRHRCRDFDRIRAETPTFVIRSDRPGAIQAIHLHGLVTWAEHPDCTLVLRHAIGVRLHRRSSWTFAATRRTSASTSGDFMG